MIEAGARSGSRAGTARGPTAPASSGCSTLMATAPIVLEVVREDRPSPCRPGRARARSGIARRVRWGGACPAGPRGPICMRRIESDRWVRPAPGHPRRGGLRRALPPPALPRRAAPLPAPAAHPTPPGCPACCHVASSYLPAQERAARRMAHRQRAEPDQIRRRARAGPRAVAVLDVDAHDHPEPETRRRSSPRGRSTPADRPAWCRTAPRCSRAAARARDRPPPSRASSARRAGGRAASRASYAAHAAICAWVMHLPAPAGGAVVVVRQVHPEDRRPVLPERVGRQHRRVPVGEPLGAVHREDAARLAVAS